MELASDSARRKTLESIPALCGCHRIEALQDRLNLPGTGGRPIEARERGRVGEEPLEEGIRNASKKRR
jgi:hypothetical protein